MAICALGGGGVMGWVSEGGGEVHVVKVGCECG